MKVEIVPNFLIIFWPFSCSSSMATKWYWFQHNWTMCVKAEILKTFLSFPSVKLPFLINPCTTYTLHTLHLISLPTIEINGLFSLLPSLTSCPISYQNVCAATPSRPSVAPGSCRQKHPSNIWLTASTFGDEVDQSWSCFFSWCIAWRRFHIVTWDSSVFV